MSPKPFQTPGEWCEPALRQLPGQRPAGFQVLVVTSNAFFNHKLLLLTPVARDRPDVDMGGSSGTYWPVIQTRLDLGWPLTFGFQGSEVMCVCACTLTHTPQPLENKSVIPRHP